MDKKQAVTEIIESLITRTKRNGLYTKSDIEKAIISVRGVDQRTISNWFNLLWKLEYLTQPQPNIFNLNLNRITELELHIKLPAQIDPNQTKLRGFL